MGLALSPVLPFRAAATASSSIDQLRQQQQKIEQERQNAAKERDRLSNLEQAALERLGGLEQNLQITGTQIQDSEYQLQLSTQRLAELEADLAAKERSYQRLQSATIARLRFLQRSLLSSRGWTILLQSQNFSDFLNRRRHLKLVYEADQQILATLTREADRINLSKSEVEQQKNEIALIRQQLLAQAADFQAQAQLQQDLIGRLNSDRFALEAAVTQLERDSQGVGLLIQQRVAAQRAKEAAAAKARGRNSVFVRGTGILSYPSDASITSSFGYRVHPILGYKRFHSGLDFGASYGSIIRAADTGTVIFAGWYGGYGKAVIIDHGDRQTTLYGHTSEVYVSFGQTVKRGQAIAAVGSTGFSTGPHLHFEVRRDGTPVDPAAYL